MAGAVANFAASAYATAGNVSGTAEMGEWSVDAASGSAQVDLVIPASMKGKTITKIGLRDENGRALCQQDVHITQETDELIYRYELRFTFDDE